MGVFYINGVNSMPFVKKCENTLDKTTRMAHAGVFDAQFSVMMPQRMPNLSTKTTRQAL